MRPGVVSDKFFNLLREKLKLFLLLLQVLVNFRAELDADVALRVAVLDRRLRSGLGAAAGEPVDELVRGFEAVRQCLQPCAERLQLR